MGRNWIDVSRQRTRYYSTVVISVLLPRCGSLANLFYDDILGKTFTDSLFFFKKPSGAFTFHYQGRFVFAMALEECT